MVGKILIVDDVATNRIAFKAALGDAFYQPAMAADGESCLRLARKDTPDLILLDLMLPDIPGVEVIQRLRAETATRDLPILAILSGGDEETCMAALKAGADDVLPKKVSQQALLARVRNLLRRRDAVESLKSQGAGLELLGLAESASAFEGPATIALVSDRPNIGKNWREDLDDLMRGKIIIQSREEALADANDPVQNSIPDVFLIDGETAGGGLSLMSELRSRPETRHAAICIMRPDSGAGSAATAFDQGADDLVTSEISPRELALRLHILARRKQREDRLRSGIQNGLRLAMIDPLTGLHNRRYALPHLAAIIDHATITGSTSAVMVIDLDRFKLVNDRLGHAAGDAVLVEASRRLRNSLRESDLLARIGGDEFLVALPDTTFSEATLAAERLCRVIEEQPIPIGTKSNLRVTVTVSIGLAVCTASAGKSGIAGKSGSELVADIIDRADLALLQAKAQGRNKVTVSRAAA